jgi:hypothetical protein
VNTRIRERNDGGCLKIETYLGIRLLEETIFLRITIRIKHLWYLLLQDTVFGTKNSCCKSSDLIMRIANYCLMFFYVFQVTAMCGESPNGMRIHWTR